MAGGWQRQEKSFSSSGWAAGRKTPPAKARGESWIACVVSEDTARRRHRRTIRGGRARSGGAGARWILGCAASVVTVCSAGEIRGPLRCNVGRFMKYWLLAAAKNRVPLPERLHNQHENHGGENGGDRGVEALVENEALRFGNFLGGNFSGLDLRGQGVRVGEETDARIRMEDFLVARGHRDHDEPRHRQQRHPNPAQAAHFHQDGGGYDERNC